MDNPDLLSCNPLMSDILSYLPYRDIIPCFRICKRFNQVIARNWRKMSKARGSICITRMKCRIGGKEMMAIGLEFKLNVKAKGFTEFCSGTFVITDEFIILKTKNNSPCLSSFLDKHAKQADVGDNVYVTSSKSEGIYLAMQSLLPKIQLEKFSINKEFNYRDENGNFTMDELVAIRDSLKSTCVNKSRNLEVQFNTAFLPIYSDIIERFGDVDHTLSFDNTLSTVLSGLNLEKREIRINIFDWKSKELVPILKKWKAGEMNIKHLMVRARDHNNQYEWKWNKLCAALQGTNFWQRRQKSMR